MKGVHQIIIVVFILIVLPSVAVANNYVDGLQSYVSGDYRVAFNLLLTEASKGRANAQTIIGSMYKMDMVYGETTKKLSSGIT